MIGKNTGITCDNLKPFQVAKIVGYNRDYPTARDAFDTILFHNNSQVIILTKCDYFYSAKIGDPFTNNAYYLEIISEPVKQPPQKLTLNDVLSLKTGEVFYYNHSSLNRSYPYTFIKLVCEDDDNGDPQRIRVEFKDDYGSIQRSFLTDCGVIKYKDGKMNSSNSLTKEPLFSEPLFS